MQARGVIAIFTADWHISENPPIARGNAESWLEVQGRALSQLCDIQSQHNKVPIFVAGDIFHKWDNSPWLLNWTLNKLNSFEGWIYTIPGNHDLPHHQYSSMHKSSYWNLVEAKAVSHLDALKIHDLANLSLSAFPHGFPTKPCKAPHDLAINVALIHDFIWTENTGHAAADPLKRLAHWKEKLTGYDVAFFGDNHKSFLAKSPYDERWCKVCNCGTLIRRNIDEKDYKPSVALLHSDGTITRHYLDISKDKFIDLDESIVKKLEGGLNIDLDDLADAMGNLHNERLNFTDFAREAIAKLNLPKGVEEILLRVILGGSK